MTHQCDLGGETVAIRYTVNSVCCLEEKFGRSLHSLLCTDVGSVRALLWCGMLHTKPDCTLEAAGEKLDKALEQGKALPDIAAQCARALHDAGFFRRAEEANPGRSPSANNTCA